MRQKRIDPEQRAELAASQPAAAIEGFRPFTVKQGQYLAFIYYYSKIHGTPPTEADFQRYFRVTPPVVHQMIKTLHTHGFIDREPGKARSISFGSRERSCQTWTEHRRIGHRTARPILRGSWDG